MIRSKAMFPAASEPLFAAARHRASPCYVLAELLRIRARRCEFFFLLAALFAVVFGASLPMSAQGKLAATPPMGWNDWAHYQCDFTAQDILENAHALVKTGLAARGYNTVTIDDCWMQKDRDAKGDLQADTKRFPQGMKPIADEVHKLGLKFGIYEDSGYATCGGFAGSGMGKNGSKAHFLQDAKLFASWGVDYLKLDGCNLYIAPGKTKNDAYRKAYKDQSAALKRVHRPIVFSESAPAYFQGTPEWYDVLAWVRGYGQLWREGSDVANYHAKDPDQSRFHSVMWNYSYNLPLGRYQSPGNWNDADFIIGGDGGMTLQESRSQLALWSMMSAPLILSSDVGKLGSEAVAVLENKDVIAVDQDPLGRMATLIQRSPTRDVLLKQLDGGDYAVAVLNRSGASIDIDLQPATFGFSGSGCQFSARELWSGSDQSSATSLHAQVDSHDTAIWRIHPASSCGALARVGTIVRIVPHGERESENYTLCLAAPGSVENCAGSDAESWTVMPDGSLENAGKCLSANAGKATVEDCDSKRNQRWRYTLAGNLVNRSNNRCLTGDESKSLTLESCGHNLATQVWSLPN